MDSLASKLNLYRLEKEKVRLPLLYPMECKSAHKLRIHKMDKKNLEIDFMGFHFSLVNAYRRIVLAEVATMAIEKVHMYKNTSLIQDEVLAHRLGLVPINAHPSYFSFRDSDDEPWTEQNCIKYSLNVKCKTIKTEDVRADPGEVDDECILVDKLVTSEHLRWVPLGDQGTTFFDAPLVPIKEDIPLSEDVQTSNKDLVLAKLNPGQSIILETYAYKSIGSDHAKFQPGLCWYRMLPKITITEPVLNDDARLLQSSFSPGVIELVKDSNGDEVAKVRDPRYDSGARNAHNYPSIQDKVVITKDPQHIIFHIESHSAMKSYEILGAAMDVMIEKCDNLLAEIEKHTSESMEE